MFNARPDNRPRYSSCTKEQNKLEIATIVRGGSTQMHNFHDKAKNYRIQRHLRNSHLKSWAVEATADW